MTSQDTNYTFNLSGKSLDLHEPVVMGILNITPDSFYDGGRFSTEESVIEQVQKMTDEGARIVDMGACSTRPGAKEIPVEEELNRLIPALTAVRKKFPDLIISVDTYRGEVVKRAVSAGADIVNDVSGGTMDNTMFDTIAALGVPYILMHMKGTPLDMQKNPTYADVVSEVLQYFTDKIERLKAAGVKQLIIDPGFGFGKTLAHNFELLKNLEKFKSFGCPVLVGMSRKSMVNLVLGVKAKDALNGTTSLNTMALLKGASILRVHDVKEAVESIKLVRQVM